MNLILDQTRCNKLTTDLYFAGVTSYSDLVGIPLDGIIAKHLLDLSMQEKLHKMKLKVPGGGCIKK